ncbi:MAG: hypothetical protein ACSW8I_10005 [bacterium]
MTKIANNLIVVLAVAALASCGTKQAEPQVEGHYTYEHAFNYDYQGNHFDVSETGTMDFYADGTTRRPQGEERKRPSCGSSTPCLKVDPSSPLTALRTTS